MVYTHSVPGRLLLSLMLPLSSVQGVDLAAVAATSPRPALCRAGSAPSQVWDAARLPALPHYCLAVARGYAALSREPRRALAWGERAAALGKKEWGANELRGRALARLGRFQPAYELLRPLGGSLLSATGSVHGLWAFARTAAVLGHHTEASEAFRSLISRAAFVHSLSNRQELFTEAGLALMHDAAISPAEAVAYLKRAEALPIPAVNAHVLMGALGLALYRDGRVFEANEIRRRAPSVWEFDSVPDPAYLTPADRAAVVAFLAMSNDAAIEKDAWQKFVRLAPQSRWREHAERRLSQLP